MKLLFASCLLVLTALSAVAWLIRPETHIDGKTPLIWVSDDNPARKEQIAMFNRLHPQYEVRLDPSNAGTQKVIVQALAGVGPDLFNCFSGMELSAYVRSGIALDVTDELPRMGVDIMDTYRVTDPAVMLDGRVYGFPTNAGADALWFNKDIFDARGIPYPKGPWTWDEFIALAQKMTERDDRGQAIRFGLLIDWWRWNQFIFQFGGSIFTPDGTRCVVDSPEAIAGVQCLRDLIYKYRVMPSPVEEAAIATQGGFGTGTVTLFGGGKAAMAMGGRWWLCLLRGQKGPRLGVTEAPHGTKRVFLGYGKGTIINRKSPRAKDALLFLAYEASKPYNDLINHQADALAPVAKFNDTEEFLHDPDYPDEDYNDVWRDVMRYAVPEQVSPYANGSVVNRIIGSQLDLVRNDQKSPAEALIKAAKQVNEEIAKTIASDPELGARYRSALAAAGTSAP